MAQDKKQKINKRNIVIPGIVAAALAVSGAVCSPSNLNQPRVQKQQTTQQAITTTIPNEPGLVYLERLPEGFSLLASFRGKPQAIVKHDKSLDNLVSALSREKEKGPLSINFLHNGKIIKLGEFPIPKYGPDAYKNIREIATSHFAVAHGKIRYDNFTTCIFVDGEWINSNEIWASELEQMLAKKSNPERIYWDGRNHQLAGFPVAADKGYLILDDKCLSNKNYNEFLILNLEEARKRAKENNVMSYEDLNKQGLVMKVPLNTGRGNIPNYIFERLQKVPKEDRKRISELVRGYLEKDAQIGEIIRQNRERFPKSFGLVDIYNLGKNGIMCGRGNSSGGQRFVVSEVDFKEAGYTGVRK